MLILRYSNFETDTLQEHIAHLGSNGVMWGWWKKAHEAFPEDLLSLAAGRASQGALRIGLVSRADEQYAVATCTQLYFREDGRSVSTPDPDATPPYYRNEPCAAWFRFLSIVFVSSEEWVLEFGPVPTSDPTLFEARRARPTQYPTPVIAAQAKPGQHGVLHLSDLHFGGDHGYRNNGGPTLPPQSLAEKIAANPRFKPACLVVSGDLTTGGQHSGLLEARMFLDKLVALLNLDRDAVVVVPGNHDILLDDFELTRDYRNEQDFRDQLHVFYERSTELERVHDIRDSWGRHYVIGTVNSSRPRHKETLDYGYVGIDRSAPVFETVHICAELAREAAWTAVVLHHHVLPGPLVEEPEAKRPVSMTLDAGELVSLAQRWGVQALLHGHQHLPFVGTVARLAEFTADGATDLTPASNVAVLGAGSAGVSRDRIPDAVGVNTYSFYTPFGSDGTLVECFGYLEKRNVHRLWKISV